MLIFISYSHVDKAFADSLADTLRSSGFEVWHDITSLRGGEQWATSIDSAVSACDAFLVVLTSEAVNSQWVRKETLLALDRNKRVIPLLLKTVDIPVHLFDIQYLDFRGDQRQARSVLQQVLKSPGQPLPTPKATNAPTSVNVNSRTVLREVLVRHFSDNELRNLCFRSGCRLRRFGRGRQVWQSPRTHRLSGTTQPPWRAGSAHQPRTPRGQPRPAAEVN
jgi:hypothetical protein